MKLKKETVKFWGKEHVIEPELIDKKFGDGKQCIYIEPLNTRPDFYIVYIDSKIDIDDNESVIEYLECEGSVFDHIESEYGMSDCFPSLDIDCGYSFGGYEWR